MQYAVMKNGMLLALFRFETCARDYAALYKPGSVDIIEMIGSGDRAI